MRTLKRLLGWVVLLPVAIAVVALAVANRGPVPVTWNPFGASDPSHIISLPLFLVMFAFFGGGLLTGGFVVWNAQRRFRRAAREGQRSSNKLKAELERLKVAGNVPAISNPR